MSYYLLDNPNPNAVGGFHGYSGRRKEVRMVVVHTTQNRFDTVGADTGAENVASYLSRTSRQASYHDIADSDSWVKCLPWTYTAFGARGYNADAVHVALAGDAYKWHELSEQQKSDRMHRGAFVVATALHHFGLPPVRLSTSQAQGSGLGVCGHYQLDPDRRSDPGAGFPWDYFMDLVEGELMAFSPHEEKVLKQLVAALDEMDSDGWFAKYTVKHLRDHPESDGGITETDARRVARSIVNSHAANPDAHHD